MRCRCRECKGKKFSSWRTEADNELKNLKLGSLSIAIEISVTHKYNYSLKMSIYSTYLVASLVQLYVITS
jgi:hypothetical protein